jgi:hypothetical protein
VVNLNDYFAWSPGLNGYQILPNGLILQWGQTTSGGGAGGTFVAYPFVFPNATLTVTCSESEATAGIWGAGNPTLHASGGQSANGFQHLSMSWNGTAWLSQPNTCMWHAVGF